MGKPEQFELGAERPSFERLKVAELEQKIWGRIREEVAKLGEGEELVGVTVEDNEASQEGQLNWDFEEFKPDRIVAVCEYHMSQKRFDESKGELSRKVPLGAELSKESQEIVITRNGSAWKVASSDHRGNAIFSGNVDVGNKSNYVKDDAGMRSVLASLFSPEAMVAFKVAERRAVNN